MTLEQVLPKLRAGFHIARESWGEKWTLTLETPDVGLPSLVRWKRLFDYDGTGLLTGADVAAIDWRVGVKKEQP